MSAFTAVLGLFVVISLGLSQADNPEHLAENERRNVGPEYLDMLLANKQYDLFAQIMDVPVSLVRPNEGERNENPMFHKELELGDILPARGQPLKEESRQGIRFERYGGSKWPKTMPYVISNDFTARERNAILNAIRRWNSQLRNCLELKPRNGEKDYILVFPGNGCWSYLGRIRGEQGLSLGNGCVSQGTILHEFMHACGFAHEQNRSDRDDYIEMFWNNIADDWKSEYQKTDPNDFGLQCHYDYYSIMHYTVIAPGTNKPAYSVKKDGIDENRIGRGNDFTQTDIDKIKELYNC